MGFYRFKESTLWVRVFYNFFCSFDIGDTYFQVVILVLVSFLDSDAFRVVWFRYSFFLGEFCWGFTIYILVELAQLSQFGVCCFVWSLYIVEFRQRRVQIAFLFLQRSYVCRWFCLMRDVFEVFRLVVVVLLIFWLSVNITILLGL